MNTITSSTTKSQIQMYGDTKVFGIALLMSIFIHAGVMKALPWIESVKTKVPINIIAEIQTLSAPPPPKEAPAPVNTIEPEKKATEQPKPTPKAQSVAVPVLAAKNVETDSSYTVPNIPTPDSVPTQPAPVGQPETQTNETNANNNVSNSINHSPASNNSTWDDSEIWDEYGNSLQKLCERNKQYPAIAIRRGYQGSGKVLVRFSAEGKALSIVMDKSTGQKSLDDQAIEMVKKSLAELPVPSKFKGREFRVSIPVDFKLE